MWGIVVQFAFSFSAVLNKSLVSLILVYFSFITSDLHLFIYLRSIYLWFSKTTVLSVLLWNHCSRECMTMILFYLEQHAKINQGLLWLNFHSSEKLFAITSKDAFLTALYHNKPITDNKMQKICFIDVLWNSWPEIFRKMQRRAPLR